MKATIRKWGNSLAFRIPRPLAQQAGLEEGSGVVIEAGRGILTITPGRSKPALADLLHAITPRNLHGPIDTGRPVGREAW
jgi:antitoxin MazE